MTINEYGPRPGDFIPETLEEQMRRKGIRPIQDVSELAAPGIWESDEEVENFISFVYASRRGEI